MSCRETFWLAARTPQGELEPLAEMGSDEVICLALEASLQGLTVQEWLLTVLRISIKKDQAEYWPATTPEQKMGRWIEIPFSREDWNLLRHSCWGYMDSNLEEFVSCLLGFVAWPGQALQAERLSRRRLPPEEMALALIAHSSAQMELPFPGEDRVKEQERQRFIQRLRTGHYNEALRRARFKAKARPSLWQPLEAAG